jgi:ATP-binding cassette subfamily F protein uup
VRALESLRVERAARRDRLGTVKLQTTDAERSGKLVFEAKGIDFSRADRFIVRDFSTTIMRGDRVGLIGPNGSGKTTLLRLLLGELTPDRGTVRAGTNIELAYFDQLREQLDPDRSVFDSVADGADFVTVGGATKHVHGYLEEFLFPTSRARTPVRALSGGERNRLLLARLFTRSFNLLVLDEPTNDLDIETLDLLEALLLEFNGTLLLVSHDRAFLDNVVTSTLALEGGGRVGEYAGGYTDWLRQRPDPAAASRAAGARSNAPAAPATSATPVTAIAPVAKGKPRRLSYKETHELAALPDRIDALETERTEIHMSLSDVTFVRNADEVRRANARLVTIETELAQLTQRWEALETLAAGG